MKFLSLSLVFLWSCSVFAATLAPGNKPYKAIVIDAAAPDFVKFAASELSTWLEKTTDGKIPVTTKYTGEKPVIFVGKSKETDRLGITTDQLKREGFKIVSKPDYLAIVGHDDSGSPIWLERHPWRITETYNKALKLCLFGDQGTLNGVYAFLQNQAGVRWYWPGTDGAVVQKTATLHILEFEMSDAPVFDYRYIYYSLNGVSKNDMLWMKRLRQGGVFPFYCMHNFKIFQKYKTTHPEYFALVDGKRDFDKLCCLGGGGHLCLTNPEVVKTFAAEICKYFDKHPNQGCFPVCPMDGLARVCGCKECQAEVDNNSPNGGKFSNHIWGFVNKVAKEVEKTYPDKIIACIAYEQYRLPPSRIPKLNKNVAVQLVYLRDQNAVTEQRKSIYDALQAWKQRSSNIYTWIHYLENNRAWKGLPVGYPELFYNEFKWLHRFGAWKGEMIQADGKNIYELDNPGMTHWKLYLTAKSHWNPDYDLKKVMNEYYKLFYGPAEKPMKLFWTTAFNAYKKAGNTTTKRTLVPEDVYTADVIETMNKALAEALKSVPPNSEYFRRISVINKEFQYGRKTLIQFYRKGKQDMQVPVIHSLRELNKLPFQRFVTRNGMPYTPNTWFTAARLNRELILRFICFEPDMQKIKRHEKTRDGNGIWTDDFIEFFICYDQSNSEYAMQFCINPSGTVWDKQYAIGISSKTWNSKSVKTSVVRQNNRWILDVRLSLDELRLNKLKSGDTVKVNFYRGRSGKKSPDYSCWSPVCAPRNFTPQRFGNLIWK